MDLQVRREIGEEMQIYESSTQTQQLVMGLEGQGLRKVPKGVPIVRRGGRNRNEPAIGMARVMFTNTSKLKSQK